MWSDDELKLIRNDGVRALIEKSKERCQVVFKELKASSPGCTFTKEQFSWALACVLSRSFLGPHPALFFKVRVAADQTCSTSMQNPHFSTHLTHCLRMLEPFSCIVQSPISCLLTTCEGPVAKGHLYRPFAGRPTPCIRFSSGALGVACASGGGDVCREHSVKMCWTPLYVASP
jgi:hypothetical protein